MTKEEFFSEDAHQTTFINRISAFLSIPFDRVRIVGIADINAGRRNLETGSEIEFVITGEAPGTEETNYKPEEEYSELKELAE